MKNWEVSVHTAVVKTVPLPMAFRIFWSVVHSKTYIYIAALYVCVTLKLEFHEAVFAPHVMYLYCLFH